MEASRSLAARSIQRMAAIDTCKVAVKLYEECIYAINRSMTDDFFIKHFYCLGINEEI